MQTPTERPEPGEVKTLRRLLGQAEAKLDAGQMLDDFEGKAYLDMQCYREAKSRGTQIPPCTLPLVQIGRFWTHGQCEIDGQGRATVEKVPSFGFWCDLMRATGPWVQTIGLEASRFIAQLLESPESRRICLRALGLLTLHDDSLPDAIETERQFKRASKSFGRGMPRVSAALIEAEDGPSSSRRSEPMAVNLQEFFETEGVAK